MSICKMDFFTAVKRRETVRTFFIKTRPGMTDTPLSAAAGLMVLTVILLAVRRQKRKKTGRAERVPGGKGPIPY